MENELYSRSKDLIKNYTDFINSLNKDDVYENITIDKLTNLKRVFSNINNIMTLIATRAIAKKIASILNFQDPEKQDLFNNIDATKANSNGFDIKIDDPKILVEVKCNNPIHDNKFGAAQITAILNDAYKLKNPNEKACKTLKYNINEYFKIIAIVNFNSKPNEKLVSQIKDIKNKDNSSNNQNIKESLEYLDLNELPVLLKNNSFENVYITVLSKDELDNELIEIVKNIKQQSTY